MNFARHNGMGNVISKVWTSFHNDLRNFRHSFLTTLEQP